MNDHRHELYSHQRQRQRLRRILQHGGPADQQAARIELERLEAEKPTKPEKPKPPPLRLPESTLRALEPDSLPFE